MNIGKFALAFFCALGFGYIAFTIGYLFEDDVHSSMIVKFVFWFFLICTYLFAITVILQIFIYLWL